MRACVPFNSPFNSARLGPQGERRSRRRGSSPALTPPALASSASPRRGALAAARARARASPPRPGRCRPQTRPAAALARAAAAPAPPPQPSRPRDGAELFDAGADVEAESGCATPHSGYHGDARPGRFFEGWYFRVTLPLGSSTDALGRGGEPGAAPRAGPADSFAWMFSVEDPARGGPLRGVGAQASQGGPGP